MIEEFEKAVAELNLDRSDWQLVKFGDVAVQQKQIVDRENTDLTRYVKGEHMYSEDIHLREWGELKDEYLGPAFIRKFEEGDILYGSRRTYLRKVVIAPFEGITSNTTFVIKANEEKIDKRLLPFIMLSERFSQHSIKNSKGSVNPYVNWKDLANFEFLLPDSNTQSKILALLLVIDEVKQVKLKLLLKFEKLVKSAINNNTFGKKHSKLKVSKLGLIPEHWEVKSIQEISDLVTKGTTPSSLGYSFTNTGVNFIKAESLTVDGGFKTHKFEHINDEAHNVLKRSQLKPNDILFSIAGVLGRTAIVSEDLCPANTNQALAIIRINDSLSSSFIYYFLKTDFIIQSLIKLKVQAAQPNLSLKNINEFLVPIPPSEEQESISENLAHLDSIYIKLKDENILFTNLSNSISNKVF